MRTSRLKSMIILVLAGANLFLLILTLSLRTEKHDELYRTERYLITLFEKDGIAFSPSLLSEESPPPKAEPLYHVDTQKQFAQMLLGTIDAVDSGGGVYRYRSGDSYCLFRGNGAVEAALSRSIDSPEEFCRELFASFGYQMTGKHEDGIYEGVYLAEEQSVYNATLRIYVSDGKMYKLSGTFLCGIHSTEEESASLDATSALVQFMDARRRSGIVCTEIMGMSGGYLLQGTMGATAELVPVWCVETDVYRYFVRASDGAVVRA